MPQPAVRRLAFAVAVLAALCSCGPAMAQKRVALVVGNSAYLNANPLANPVNDASDVGEALKDAGFGVVLGLDLDKRGFDAKVREFSRLLSEADTGVLFYAGHGLQVSGRN